MNDLQNPPSLELLLRVIEKAQSTDRTVLPDSIGRVCEGRHAFALSTIGPDTVQQCCDSRECPYKIMEEHGQYCVLRAAFAAPLQSSARAYELQ